MKSKKEIELTLANNLKYILENIDSMSRDDLHRRAALLEGYLYTLGAFGDNNIIKDVLKVENKTALFGLIKYKETEVYWVAMIRLSKEYLGIEY